MKFSEKWLRKWVNPKIGTEELLDQLTMLGLEVDSSQSLKDLFEGVVVGEVVSVEPHPDADRLRVCRVSDNSAEWQVVCRAPNVVKGMKTAFAKVGAKLPSGMEIKKTKLCGVESNGMLCSESELKLSDSSEGLMVLSSDAPTGTSLNDFMQLDDTVIDIDITPNRGDCFCIRGIARDISARNNLSLKEQDSNQVQITSSDSITVEVLPDCACVRYTGRVLNDIDNSIKSPLWLTERLRRSGVRAISLVVDVTNYVMLELGQPMHAFDMVKLSGAIRVRKAKKNEPLSLLDGRDILLNDDTTIIADDSGAIGIAGIMGGSTTGCDQNTTQVFLESALFLPEQIAGKSRFYSVHTESGHRFERGVDSQLQHEALEYASRLLLEICEKGNAGEICEFVDDSRLPSAEDIQLRKSRIKKLLGFDIDAAQVESVLGKLGVTLTRNDLGWMTTAPSYRYDIRLEADLIEELARVYGFENLPRTFPGLAPEFKAVEDNQNDKASINQFLCTIGFQEVITYSFVDGSIQSQLHPAEQALPLANPISSDMGVMRISHWTGLLTTLQRNLNRQLSDVNIFESGLVFRFVDDQLTQEPILSGLMSGKKNLEHWSNDPRNVDFFDMKGIVEALCAKAHLQKMEFIAAENPALHPGQSAKIVHQGKFLGWVGALRPNLQKTLNLSQTVLMFEINQKALETGFLPSFQDISKYPAVRRDISVVLNDKITMADIENAIVELSPEYLEKTVVFDVYRGENVAIGLKSIALGLILQNKSRTLSEGEVGSSVASIIKVLEEKFSATLRM